MSDELQKFITLFRGRADVYGHEEGRCVKEVLTPEVFSNHLQGIEPIGVYPLVPMGDEFGVVWGCSDIDIEDLGMATSLHDALQAGGAHPYIERSRSKGYHVWVFAPSLVSAISMRNMFLAAHQVADIPAREVNPKQVRLTAGQYGNYVRLPYVGGLHATPDKRVVLDRQTFKPVPLVEFLDNVQFTEPDVISTLAAFYKPPVQHQQIVHDGPVCEDLSEALRVLSPLGKVIWRDGPLPNRDRSSTLTKLAYVCAECFMSPSQAKLVLVDADKRWGKYHLRGPAGELEIDKLLSRVFS